MTTYVKLDEFKKRLMKMSKEQLVEAISEYAISNYLIWGHFDALGKINETPEQCLALVKARIDDVFGNQELESKYDFDGMAQFKCIPDFIESLLKSQKYDETIEASEHAFSYDENLGQVQDPDDFMEDCYNRIVDCWLIAQISTGIPINQIEAGIEKRRLTDGFGLAYLMLSRLSKLVQAGSAK
ncbi:hypothetical protein KA183_19045 [bacterium]|nr:hypothetical protein [bacterium]